MKNIKNLKYYEKMLIVVDMVNGFIKEGALHDKEIEKIVPRQIELIKKAKKSGYLVVFIKDTHENNSTEHKRFGGFLHCIRETGEEEIIDELKQFENDAVLIEKNSTSFMESPMFRELTANMQQLKEVDIIGCCTDICVFNGAMGLANYFDQWNKAVEIKIHQDAIATFEKNSRKNYIDAAFLLMEQQGIKLVKKR